MEKASNPGLLFENRYRFPDALRIMIESHHLANLFRKGWLETGRAIPREYCESVAEHTMGMRYIMHMIKRRFSLRLEHKNMDWGKISDMIDMHDLPEVYAGDITPADGFSKIDKHNLEVKGLQKLLCIDKFPEALYDFELWLEFQKKESPEACFVADVDYFQMIMKARLYEKYFEHIPKDLSSFYEERKERLHNKIFIELFQYLLDDY